MSSFSKGWIDVIQARLQADPDALIAPMLLYERSIAAFGMRVGFDGSQTNPIPCNFHSLKGLHPSQLRLDDALDGIQEPQAISGAVLAFQGYLLYVGILTQFSVVVILRILSFLCVGSVEYYSFGSFFFVSS